jgi:hypothetical protein
MPALLEGLGRNATGMLISRGVLQWSRNGRLILTVTPSNRFGSLSVYGSDALGIQDLMSTTPS